MDKQTAERSPEFRQFLQQVEAALLKSSAEARRLAEQTGTKFIVCEDCGRETYQARTATIAATGHDEKPYLAE